MVDEATLQVVRGALGGVKVAAPHDRVLKNECCFSFDTAESPGGIYINLRTFQAFGEEFLALDQQRTKNTLYLHEKAHRVPLEEEGDAEKEAVKIRPEGGMQVSLGGGPKYRLEKKKELVVLDPSAGSTLRVPLPCPDLPELLLQAIASLEAHEDSSTKDHVTEWAEELRPSRYAENLPQLEATRKISPNPQDWRCDESGVTENLWLNLSTGFIGSGRQNFDGSGGNGAALRHYEATGRKYPLVVKLGTLSPHGGDVYSYADDENDMVLDPFLAQHLAHWGINMMQMEKTEKTTAELQLEMNLNYEYSRITEEGSKMTPLSGPGLTGLINLGNTCYMNSVLQLLAKVPEFCSKYVNPAGDIFKSAPTDPTMDLGSQLSKVAVALTQGRIGHTLPPEAPPTDNTDEAKGVHPPKPTASEDLKVLTRAVRPAYFKSIIGKGHPEFSTIHQQDAVEFFQHLLNQVARFERARTQRMGGAADATLPMPNYFDFQVQERDRCSESKLLRYKFQDSNVLALGIPEEAATNRAEVAAYKERAQQYQAAGETGQKPEPVIPNVPFAACIERFAAPEEMADVFSPALGRKVPATRTTRLASFPPYLMLSFKRYYVAENWVPKKLEVAVDVPTRISLEHLRGKGPQPGEALQPDVPEGPQQAPAPALTADPALVAQLASMGFSEAACTRAALAVKNAGPEAAMEWVLAHMEDPDINAPLAPASSAASGGAMSEEALSTLSAMGFTSQQAEKALKACDGNVERAVDWLFSHADDPMEDEEPQQNAAKPTPAVVDGPGEYELVGFVSHMGSNTACGHYVAHIRVDGRWVIYNDEKVAESEHPPLDLGYMYMFKRIDV